MIGSLLSELAAWWRTVTPEFAFLLALPFAVALAGWLSESLGRRRLDRSDE
jgi:hypothetical protein